MTWQLTRVIVLILFDVDHPPRNEKICTLALHSLFQQISTLFNGGDVDQPRKSNS